MIQLLFSIHSLCLTEEIHGSGETTAGGPRTPGVEALRVEGEGLLRGVRPERGAVLPAVELVHRCLVGTIAFFSKI